MRLDQTIGSLTCGDLEISLRLRVTELKKMGFVYLLNLFGQRGEKGGCDLMHRNVCGATLDDWANGGSADVFFTYGEYGFSSMVQNYVALLQGSEISTGLHSRKLILGI